jgi:hypothetical protein
MDNKKTFRINKSDIKVRPIQHRLSKRIEADICICFAVYKIIKELEHQFKEKSMILKQTK